MSNRKMASKIEASKSLKHFDGEGDVSAWLAKIELVASLTDVKDVAKLVPLYLEGGALSLYLELEESKKKDYSQLAAELLRAYSDSQFVSFSKLKAVKWTGETVEVYANNIRKLARGAGLKGEGLEQVVKLAFITGFPDSISEELQQVDGIESMPVSAVLGRARVLAASNAGAGCNINNVAASVARKGGIKCYT